MLRICARGDITGAGNGPSPRRRAARAFAAPTTHQSGIGAKSCTNVSFSARVSGATASGRNNAGSSGLVIAVLPVAMGVGGIMAAGAGSSPSVVSTGGRPDRRAGQHDAVRSAATTAHTGWPE
jgi:hypothetical protein